MLTLGEEWYFRHIGLELEALDVWIKLKRTLARTRSRLVIDSSWVFRVSESW